MLYWCNFGALANLSTDTISKNRLKISLESANLQEHYNTMLQGQNAAYVAVMIINCILFTTINHHLDRGPFKIAFTPDHKLTTNRWQLFKLIGSTTLCS